MMYAETEHKFFCNAYDDYAERSIPLHFALLRNIFLRSAFLRNWKSLPRKDFMAENWIESG